MSQKPGVSRAFSNILHFAQRPISFMREIKEQYGDFVPMWMGPMPFFLVFHPDYAQHILQTNQKNYLHSRLIFDKLIPLTGEKGLVQLEGSMWKKHRQITNASFKPKQLESFVPMIVAVSQQAIQKLNKKKSFEVCDEMTDLVLQTAMRMLFSLEAQEHIAVITQAFLEANRCCGRRIKSILHVPHFLPSPNNLRFRRAVKTLDNFAYSMIKKRREENLDINDMLGSLMSERDEQTGQGMSDLQLRDHMMTFLFAGHETTACSLSWCFYLIAQHPHVEKKVKEEIHNVLGDRNPEYADIPQLKYISMVYQEALRLYPPAWILARQPVTSDEIAGHKVGKYCNLLLSVWEIHRHPHFWKDPESFIPERFSTQEARHRFAFIPFGAGPRICSGTRLSLIEGVLIIAVFLKQHTLNLIPNQKIEVETTITARPRYGIHMEIKQT